jgi:uncharacterized protein
LKRLLVAALLCVAFSPAAFSQENDQTPASKADIQTYFETVGSHEQLEKIMNSMQQPMREALHQQYLNDKDRLPADFEKRMTKTMDGMIKNMPMDEMMQAMIPTYQKHFTKGDVNALLAFYSSPTGQKLLREMPEITSESMAAMMPIMNRYIDEMQKKLQKEADAMMKEAEKRSEPPAKN